MSAFLVSEAHIQFVADTLAEATVNRQNIFSHCVLWFMDKLGYDLYSASVAECKAAVVAVANQLYELNEIALHGRYGDEVSGNHPVERIKYTAIHATPYQQYKALSCLHYQCSEPIANESELYKHLGELRSGMAVAIVIRTDQYDRAAWEVTAAR